MWIEFSWHAKSAQHTPYASTCSPQRGTETVSLSVCPHPYIGIFWTAICRQCWHPNNQLTGRCPTRGTPICMSMWRTPHPCRPMTQHSFQRSHWRTSFRRPGCSPKRSNCLSTNLCGGGLRSDQRWWSYAFQTLGSWSSRTPHERWLHEHQTHNSFHQGRSWCPRSNMLIAF